MRLVRGLDWMIRLCARLANAIDRKYPRHDFPIMWTSQTPWKSTQSTTVGATADHPTGTHSEVQRPGGVGSVKPKEPGRKPPRLP